MKSCTSLMNCLNFASFSVVLRSVGVFCPAWVNPSVAAVFYFAPPKPLFSGDIVQYHFAAAGFDSQTKYC